MTGLPPNPNNQLAQQLAALNNNIRQLNNTAKKGFSSGSVISRNIQSLNDLKSKTLDLTDLIGNVYKVMTKMDDLQKRSLALGTTATKFLNVNNETLKKLRGDFLENAEDIFKNFDAGIRENSDELNLLQNRMRLTGQSTELARKVSLLLLNTTGNNINAVNNVAKSNRELAKTSLMTNTSLLELVDSLSDLIEEKSLFGLSEQFTQLVQMVGAKIGPGNNELIQQTLRFMSSPQFLAQRQSIGLQEIDLSRGLEDSFETVISNLEKTKSFKESFVGANPDAMTQQLKQLALEDMGLLKGVTTSVNLLNKVINATEVSKKLATKEDKYYDSFENYKSEALSTYSMVGEFYPKLLEYAPLIITTLQGLQTAMGAGSFFQNGGPTKGVGGLLMRAGSILGPIAAAGGMVALMAHAMSDREGITKAMKLNAKKVSENTEGVEKNTKLVAEINKDKIMKEDPVSSYMKQTLYQVNATLVKQRDAEMQKMKQSQEANGYLKEIYKTLGIKGPSIGNK